MRSFRPRVVTKAALKRAAECVHVFGPSAALNYEICLRGCGKSRKSIAPALDDFDRQAELKICRQKAAISTPTIRRTEK